MAQGFTLISSLAWTYRITPAKLPDRQPAVKLGQEVPVVVEVVISLVIGSTSMNGRDRGRDCYD